ncbi:MAG: hypothetical protein NTU91_17525 [Chloroflexi bacterium]|nr:hypothetical protein [Chloroflexota bacterium]
MVEGTTYALPECWPLDAQADKGAPCLVSVTSERSSRSAQTSGDAIGASAVLTTDQITCGVTVKSKVGITLGKLWETITITWYEYTWKEVGASRGTWVMNSSYTWTGLSGPIPSSGEFAYSSNRNVRVSGTFNFLGAPYHSYTVYLTVFGYQNWTCSVT